MPAHHRSARSHGPQAHAVLAGTAGGMVGGIHAHAVRHDVLLQPVGTMDYLVFKPGFSLENFHKLWSTEPYVSVLMKSAKLGLLTAVLSAIIAYPLAFCLAFHTRSQRAKYLFYMLVIVPWWASYLVKAYAWKTILGTNGLINGVLICGLDH
jgi:ABC-type spermidine/putrescine transport system permease subunit I